MRPIGLKRLFLYLPYHCTICFLGLKSLFSFLENMSIGGESKYIKVTIVAEQFANNL